MALKGFAAFTTVLGWFVVFVAGMTINSQPYRDAMTGGAITFSNAAMTFLTYTVTNAGILCMLSGVAGGLAQSIMTVASSGGTVPSATIKEGRPSVTDSLFIGALRSFAVYLLYLSGIYIGASDAFGSTSPGQYARVVATTSLIGFVVSYNPAVFQRLLERFTPQPQKDANP